MMSGVETAAMYETFAADEGDGRSPTYAALARAVAADERLLALLDTVPERCRQPNLLFGALRWYDAPLTTDWAVGHWPEVRAVLTTRRTQTNEPTRCALLLPALATLPEPLAIVEVGASAGLCLLYDRWAYDYDGVRVGDGPVTLRCAVSGGVPIPDRVPQIAWRAGLDLNPLDPRDPDTRRWLECLVWPEHDDRREVLRGALAVAAQDPPRIVQGDLLRDLSALLDEVPAGLTTVVTHTAVLAYVDDATGAAFADLCRERGVHRLGGEGYGSDFVISLDGTPLARGHPHGRRLAWG
jgi:hypothetical protein